MKKISVVVPVYNEEENIQELYDRLKTVFCTDLKDFDYEFIFVDDGSVDLSFNLLKNISQKDSRVGVIKFTRNFGQHPAMSAGFKSSSGDYVVLMDADLQNPPEEIPNLVKRIVELNVDIVYGVRIDRHDTWLRKIGSKIYHKILTVLLGIEMAEVATTFRVMSQRVIKNFIKFPEQSSYTGALIAWMGFKSAFVDTKHENRNKGKSKYSTLCLLGMTLDIVIGFSARILRFIIWVGILLSGFSFILGGYFLLRKLFLHKMLPGFPSLVVLITFFFGIFFIFLGIIGEYIARIFQNGLSRPYYIVDVEVNFNNKFLK